MFVSEREIISCMKENFRLSAECCDLLAVVPARGLVYERLRAHLSLIEGCCRQVAWYRGDTRWLPMGMLMEQAHRRSGNWLRTMPRTENVNTAHPLFLKLAENLRAGQRMAERLETAATGKLGLILPEAAVNLPTIGGHTAGHA